MPKNVVDKLNFQFTGKVESMSSPVAWVSVHNIQIHCLCGGNKDMVSKWYDWGSCLVCRFLVLFFRRPLISLPREMFFWVCTKEISNQILISSSKPSLICLLSSSLCICSLYSALCSSFSIGGTTSWPLLDCITRMQKFFSWASIMLERCVCRVSFLIFMIFYYCSLTSLSHLSLSLSFVS